jgi:phosphate-selective porin OprO/OprP
MKVDDLDMSSRSGVRNIFYRTALGCIVLGFVLVVAEAHAGEGSESGTTKPLFDRLWGFATLYENPENPVLQEFSLRGRLQADFPVVDANSGEYDQPQMRRIRMGAKTKWLADLILQVGIDLDGTCEDGEDCGDSAYEGLTDAFLGWAPNRAFTFKVGKISAPFTLDGATSSNRLMTLERNNVSNNLWFPAEYHAGVSANGQIRSTRYFAGVFSSSTTEEFGSFDGGYFMLLTLAHDFSSRFDVPEFLVSLNYVYNESDRDNVGTRDLAHVASLHVEFDTGRWGIRSDVSAGLGYDSQSDLAGLTLMPFYHITESFQLVARYSYLNSFSKNGLRFARYESKVESERGDEYNEFFAGLNWFVYGHALKLQTGVQYTIMEDEADDGGDYRGWAWSTGIRMSW